MLHAPAVHFKGKGFYNTDYGTRKRQRENAAASAAGSSSDSSSGGEKGAGEKASKDGAAAKGSSAEGKSAEGGSKSEKGSAGSKKSDPVGAKS